MLWEQAGSKGSKLGGSLRSQEGSRDPGMLWEQGEQAGSEGSELGAGGVSWDFLRPQEGSRDPGTV